MQADDEEDEDCPKFLTAASKRELGPCLSPHVVVRSLKPTTSRGRPRGGQDPDGR